jgi:mono/diheme cytochrome c family protein
MTATMVTKPLTLNALLALSTLLFSNALTFFAAPTLYADDQQTIEFNRDVRPILSDYCFACHGPDKNHREADLRLDTESGLLGDDKKPGAIVPGKPEESELLRRVLLSDGEEKMPPAEFGKQLDENQIKILRQWIEQGGSFQGHWAFQPIARPSPPTVDANVVSNDIDRFILKDLVDQNTTFAPEADRRTLARRLSFDLTGLPPTADLVERFVHDPDPQAYEKLVDELLASEHYGERMAMWWLDLVRYADTVGYHGDQNVGISPFRDYVIRSFNQNRPFDRFTIEQLAGDLLPSPSQEHLIASGYNRLGMMSAEGGVQDKEYLAKYIAERVRNVGGTWMGVTLGCCECHDHKYDPFSAREFYQMEAFFADIEERGLYAGAHDSGAWGSTMQVPTPEQTAKLQELDQRIAELKKVLATSTPALEAEQAQWESTLPKWTVLKPTEVTGTGGVTLTIQEDAAILASGESPASTQYDLTFADIAATVGEGKSITAIRLEVLPDDSLPAKGPGRAGNGNFVLTEVIAGTLNAEKQIQPVVWKNATASYEQTGAAGNNPYKKWAIAAAIDLEAKGDQWGWAIMEQAGQANAAILELNAPTPLVSGTSWSISLKQAHSNPHHTLGKFRISILTEPLPTNASTVIARKEIQNILDLPSTDRNDAQKQQLAEFFRSQTPTLEPVRADLKDIEQQRDQANRTITTTLFTKAVPPRTIRVLARGNWMDETGLVVEPGFPDVLPKLTRPQRLNRLDLAQWLTSPDHPLTSRVTVNRLWKLFYGAGLSRKSDDLGSQGEWPSHPELLDWLASRLIDSQWDIKKMVRLMVTSRTYRQSSNAPPEQWQRDLDNRLFARQNRYRLDAELIRDNAMASSGLLVRTIGGKSVFPYQPPGYWAYLNFPQREWQNSNGEGLYRRGLYTHWQRQYLHPSLVTFDAPSREECTADRPRSNTPLQSLVLLNDPTYVEAARVLAQQLLKEASTDNDARLSWIFQRVLQRSIRPEERDVLIGLIDKSRVEYEQSPADAEGLLKVGQYSVPTELNPKELAVWTNVCRVVFNLSETITRP